MPANGKPRSLPLEFVARGRSQLLGSQLASLPARLKPGGTAGHLKPVTRDDHAGITVISWAFWTAVVCSRRDEPAAANVTPDKVERLHRRAKRSCRAQRHFTARSASCGVRPNTWSPDRDFTWLAEIDKDLALVARPRSKFDRLVLPEVLIEAGLTLIREAEDSASMTKLARACQVRNGLMVALLALCPIRRKNFAALEIGRSFVKIKDRWWIVLSASETKERRADERPLPELLTPVIDRYLDQHRPVWRGHIIRL